jgi:hypothetical protein
MKKYHFLISKFPYFLTLIFWIVCGGFVLFIIPFDNFGSPSLKNLIGFILICLLLLSPALIMTFALLQLRNIKIENHQITVPRLFGVKSIAYKDIVMVEESIFELRIISKNDKVVFGKLNYKKPDDLVKFIYNKFEEAH